MTRPLTVHQSIGHARLYRPGHMQFTLPVPREFRRPGIKQQEATDE